MADFEKKPSFFSTKGVVKWKVRGEKNSFQFRRELQVCRISTLTFRPIGQIEKCYDPGRPEKRSFEKNTCVKSERKQQISTACSLQLPVDLQRATLRRSRKLVITPFVFRISVLNFYSIFSIYCTFELTKKKFNFFIPSDQTTTLNSYILLTWGLDLLFLLYIRAHFFILSTFGFTSLQLSLSLTITVHFSSLVRSDTRFKKAR